MSPDHILAKLSSSGGGDLRLFAVGLFEDYLNLGLFEIICKLFVCFRLFEII